MVWNSFCAASASRQDWIMNNWHIEYRVKYHITFIHNDGRSEVVSDDRIVEARSPEDVEKIILNQYEHGDDRLIDFPKGWHGRISSEKLIIDKIEKLWEY